MRWLTAILLFLNRRVLTRTPLIFIWKTTICYWDERFDTFAYLMLLNLRRCRQFTARDGRMFPVPMREGGVLWMYPKHYPIAYMEDANKPATA